MIKEVYILRYMLFTISSIRYQLHGSIECTEQLNFLAKYLINHQNALAHTHTHTHT